MTLLAWHWFSFELPPQWEVTAYSSKADKGCLQLYTRHGFAGSISWRRVNAVPDQQRIMAEIHRRNLQEQRGEANLPTPELTFERAGEALAGFNLPGELFQASIFQPETRMLLEWVFPAYDSELYNSLIRPMLQSYRPNYGKDRRWAIFGINVALPATYWIEEFTPLPGHTVIEWRTKKRMHFCARRWALPEELLGPMTLEDFGRHLSRRLYRKVDEIAAEHIFRHEGVRMKFSLKGRVGFERIVGRWWRGECIIWWDRKAKRITSLEQYGPQGRPMLELANVWSE